MTIPRIQRFDFKAAVVFFCRNQFDTRLCDVKHRSPPYIVTALLTTVNIAEHHYPTGNDASNELTAVEFHNQLLVDALLAIFAAGKRRDFCGQVSVRHAHPFGGAMQ